MVQQTDTENQRVEWPYMLHVAVSCSSLGFRLFQ